jgi:HEAT repeat protein
MVFVIVAGCGGRTPAAVDRDAQANDDSTGIRRPVEFWIAQLKSNKLAERQEALAALVTYGPEAAPYVEEISARVDDPDDRSGATAAWALARIPAGYPILLKYLKSPITTVRQRVAYGLGQEKVDAAVPALEEIASSDRNLRVRGMATWAINQINRKGGADPTMFLSIGLDDINPDVRLQAVRRLGVNAQSNRLAIPLLIGLLDDSIPAVRNAAIDELSRAGPVGATALTAMLSARNPSVRWAAMMSLARRPRSF